MPLSVRGGCGDPVLLAGLPEGGQHDRAGNADVGGERQDVAGVVVEPREDLAVVAGRQRVVGEVGLPGLVGLVGFEADVGRAGPLLGLGDDEPGVLQVAVDRRGRDLEAVVVVQHPGDRVRAGVETLAGEVAAHAQDRVDRGGGQCSR
jgi:hypothetical protein